MNEQHHHLDNDAISELKLVMEDDFALLVETYLSDSVERMSSLRQAVNSENAQDLRMSAHSFKGSCTNMGVPYLADLLAQAEEMGRSNALAGAAGILQEIEHEYLLVDRMLREYIN